MKLKAGLLVLVGCMFAGLASAEYRMIPAHDMQGGAYLYDSKEGKVWYCKGKIPAPLKRPLNMCVELLKLQKGKKLSAAEMNFILRKAFRPR